MSKYHVALYSIKLHEVEAVQSYTDQDHAYTRLQMLRAEAQQRGGDWTIYSAPVAFAWDIVDHKETEPERLSRLSTEARSKRDSLLSASDRYLLADWPIPDGSTRAEWTAKVKTYRQALRDLPAQEGFPAAITWPAEPGATESAHA